jgi:DNA-binding MarR family transcriptional regulator
MKDRAASARKERSRPAKPPSTLQLLFRCARVANERARAELPLRKDTSPIRPSHAALFPHITPEGTRITALALALGTSKQAVAQSVDELEAMGLVARTTDAADARARLVVWTERGKQVVGEGNEALEKLERALREALGDTQWDAMREGLLALDAELTREGVVV